MNWLKNKLRSWIFSDNEVVESKQRGLRVTASRDIDTDRNGMNFCIMNAVGGYVMQYSIYDEKNDRHDRRLHIITSDQDLGQSISHIVTYEMLRK